MLAYLRAWFRKIERRQASRERRGGRWVAEELEARLLLTTYTPAQISQAYGVNLIQFGSVKGDGTGQTIAIVDAYDAPNINKDLMTFDATYGLSNNDGKGSFVLTKATPQGKPAYNAGWAEEITLDVEWAHAIAPGAHILLVEAVSNSYTDLLAAVNYARNQVGVSVVSMSWGGSEFAGETAYDTYFTTPAGHQGVTFVASAGDSGAIPEYPAVSPNVLSVGGTTLKTATTAGTYGSETTWTASGGGISVYESKPSFQATVTQSATKRTTPDVAYDANPGTGVSVYFTGSNGRGTWYTFGGTSIGAPQWAALIAIANQGRVLSGLGTLDGRSQTLPAIYRLPSTDFHDVTQGIASTGRTSLSATVGYDLVTGRGTPYANLVVRDLVSVTYAGGTVTRSGTVSSSTTVSAHTHLIEVSQSLAIPVERLSVTVTTTAATLNSNGLQLVQSQMGLSIRFQPAGDSAPLVPGSAGARTDADGTSVVPTDHHARFRNDASGGSTNLAAPADGKLPRELVATSAGSAIASVDAFAHVSPAQPPVADSILAALAEYHARNSGDGAGSGHPLAARGGMVSRGGVTPVASAAFLPWMSPKDADRYFASLGRAKRSRRRSRRAHGEKSSRS